MGLVDNWILCLNSFALRVAKVVSFVYNRAKGAGGYVLSIIFYNRDSVRRKACIPQAVRPKGMS